MLLTMTISLLIPILLFLFGLLLWLSPAGKPNNSFGYRTKRSMSNQKSWNYAQKTSGLIFTIVGFLFIPITYYLVNIIQLNQGSLIIAMLSLQMLCLFLPLTYVEYMLKKRFSS